MVAKRGEMGRRRVLQMSEDGDTVVSPAANSDSSVEHRANAKWKTQEKI